MLTNQIQAVPTILRVVPANSRAVYHAVLMNYVHIVPLHCHPYIVSLESPINGPPDSLLPAAVYQIAYTTPLDIRFYNYSCQIWLFH